MKKYVMVGTGVRGLSMFAKPITSELKDYAQLVGLYDINKARANVVSEICGNVPVFDDFDTMLSECKPDAVIVTTVDKYHHKYIIKALEDGYDVISEKPLTTDAEKCNAIKKAEKETGKKVTVTFNCRFMPHVVRIKELINDGAVGKILSVNMEWLLDTSHGADYFRRWHRKLDNSGGLLVHKATHHFDMINWWINEEPEKVYATGTLKYYGPTRENRGERCLTCKHKNSCEFYFDITAGETARKIYHNVEDEDGYYRDRCIFSDEIDIYDNMSLSVKYTNDVLFTYSLIAHSPYEGFKVSISGTNGRLEFEQFSSGHRKNEPTNEIRVYNRRGEEIKYSIPKVTGGHGGGDERLRRMIFVGDVEDTLGQQADTWQGMMSLLIGAAANISIAEGKPIVIKDLID